MQNSPSNSTPGRVFLVSRHPGALDWVHARGIAYDQHHEHLDPAILAAGDVVIGSLPVNLIAEVCQRGARYWHLSINLTRTARGRELTHEELLQYGASLQEFEVSHLRDIPITKRTTTSNSATGPS